MKQRFPDRLARWLVPLWFAFAACGVPAATLDLSPDAVLGKPDLLAAPGGATSAASLGNVGQAAEDPVTGALWVVDTAMSRVLR